MFDCFSLVTPRGRHRSATFIFIIGMIIGASPAGVLAQPICSRGDATTLRKEVEALSAAMVTAFKRDPASVARFYADDAQIMGGGARIAGRQQIDGYWASATTFTDWFLTVREVGGDSNSPWMVGRSMLTDRGGRTMTTDFVGILKRSEDCRLRFYVDIYTPAAQAPSYH